MGARGEVCQAKSLDFHPGGMRSQGRKGGLTFEQQQPEE